jgi:lambda repressor-like predicted transcriptional regulator
MGHLGNAERDAEIYARRKDGLTLAAIGREFGLSPETVRIIVKKMKLKAWWHEIEEKTRSAGFCGPLVP